MRILVVSATPWSNDNSFGSTFSNFFKGIEDLEIASVYCRSGQPDNTVVSRYFQVTFTDLLQNLKDKSVPCGHELDYRCDVQQGAEVLSDKARKSYNNARKLRWQVLFWANDLIWSIGRWRSEELRKFLLDFQPDVIFQPIYFSKHLNQIALYCASVTGAAMVGYVSDDVYTLRQFSLSPLYWIDRIWKRRYVKRTFDACKLIYTISETQKMEYQEILHKECKVLTKIADFSGEPLLPEKSDHPMQFVYTGNIGGGRWKSLALLAEAIRQVNAERQRAMLVIYTATPITKQIRKALNIPMSAEIRGQVSASEIPRIQQEADVLVHVEGLNRKSRLEVHQSFSTKLVDYFHNCRCVFAIGTPDMASIRHLLENKAAVVATNKNEVLQKLELLLRDKAFYDQTIRNAWECGRRYHNKETMQQMLMEDLHRMVKTDQRENL